MTSIVASAGTTKSLNNVICYRATEDVNVDFSVVCTIYVRYVECIHFIPLPLEAELVTIAVADVPTACTAVLPVIVDTFTILGAAILDIVGDRKVCLRCSSCIRLTLRCAIDSRTCLSPRRSVVHKHRVGCSVEVKGTCKECITIIIYRRRDDLAPKYLSSKLIVGSGGICL
jgi:hypothetical protein